MTRRVAVVGGGLAGITAALACADAGCDVTLYESRPRLGGLTHSFSRDGLWVDNGQHVFLRCCTAYQRLLTRIGSAHLVTVQPRLDIPLRSPTRSARLRRNGFASPLQVAGSLARFAWLSPMERVRFAAAALALRGVRPEDPAADRRSFADWLRCHGQSDQAIDALWDLVGVASLNARARDTSLALAATVFQRALLGPARAGDIGWSLVPLQRLHGDAAMATFEDAGVHILLHSKVASVAPVSPTRAGGGRWAVAHAAGADQVDDVILAVPPQAAQRLSPAAALDVPSGWADRLGQAPIVNLHLVLAGRVLEEPFMAGVADRAAASADACQAASDVLWVFDRTSQSGLAGGQYLAVSISAADEFIDMPTAMLHRRFWPRLSAMMPRLRSADVRDFFVTRERAATFRPAPGSASLRPRATTSLAGLCVAGAWTDTGWPATMEGAVLSGEAAAQAVLDGAARAGEAVAA